MGAESAVEEYIPLVLRDIIHGSTTTISHTSKADVVCVHTRSGHACLLVECMPITRYSKLCVGLEILQKLAVPVGRGFRSSPAAFYRPPCTVAWPLYPSETRLVWGAVVGYAKYAAPAHQEKGLFKACGKKMCTIHPRIGKTVVGEHRSVPFVQR